MSRPSLISPPAELQALLEHSLPSFLGRLDDAGQAAFAAWPEERRDALRRVLAASGELERRLAPGELRVQLAAALDGCAGEDDLARRLRRYRNRQQARIIWRDVTRQADLAETCSDLSDLADASIDLAY